LNKGNIERENQELDYSQLTETAEGNDCETNQESECLSRTKIMFVCTSNIKEESYFSGLNSIDSLIDLIMTEDKTAVIRKEKVATRKTASDNVIKHFLLTTSPTVQNYKLTANAISLASCIDNIFKEKTLSHPSPKAKMSHVKSDAQILRSTTKEIDSLSRSKSPKARRKLTGQESLEKDYNSRSCITLEGNHFLEKVKSCIFVLFLL